jgi:predicted DNA-binding ribbon-helix-helix protein
MKSPVVKRTVKFAGRNTSISIEDDFWQALRDISRQRGMSMAEMVGMISDSRQGNLSSAVRLFVLGVYQDRSAKLKAAAATGGRRSGAAILVDKIRH